MASTKFALLRENLHTFINQLSDDELAEFWNLTSEFYYDAQMLKAIHVAKRSLTPGDSLTCEEALRFLFNS